MKAADFKPYRKLIRLLRDRAVASAMPNGPVIAGSNSRDFAKRNNLDPSSYEANYGFLKFELTNTKEGQFLDQLRKAGDARSATEIVSNSFLRPGIPNMESRYKWG